METGGILIAIFIHDTKYIHGKQLKWFKLYSYWEKFSGPLGLGKNLVFQQE
jgi:hypothetical protein